MPPSASPFWGDGRGGREPFRSVHGAHSERNVSDHQNPGPLRHQRAWRCSSADGTGNGVGPEHEFLRNLIHAFAAYERALVGARTRAALRVKKAHRERVGAIAFGYRVSAEDPGALEPDPDEQEVIRVVHELREDGLSLRAIDEALRERGHLPRGGERWHVQTLSNILRTEAVAAAG